MTATPQSGPARAGADPVRAGARVSAETPGASGPAILLPRRRPGYLGPVHVMQLLLVEAVIVAVLVALDRGVALTTGASAAGLLLLAAALGRHQGRWWLERRAMTRQYRRRRQGMSGTPQADDPRVAALHRLAPGLVVENVAVADGAQVGVARDDAGWYAVAAVTPSTPMRGVVGGLPLEELAEALSEADQPGAVLQVVTQTVPAPSIDMHPSAPAGQSYHQLLARFGGVPLPADRATWVAVRLDARTLAEAAAIGDADLDAAPAVVAALVRRVTKSLRRVGVPYRLLDADGLLTALVRSCDLEPAAPATRPEAALPREEWCDWHSSRLAHRSFWIRDWPPVGQVSGLLDLVSTVPAAMTNVALIMAPDSSQKMFDLRGLVRVSAPAADLDQLCQAVAQGVEQAGADLFPLDGEQGPAVYASAPTGGGAR